MAQGGTPDTDRAMPLTGKLEEANFALASDRLMPRSP